MMKTIKALLNEGTSRRIGNHAVKYIEPSIRHFIYHSTVICVVDDRQKTFSVSNGGYNTPSTSKAINSYRDELQRTHKEISKEGEL